MYKKTKQKVNLNSVYILIAIQFTLLFLIFIPLPNYGITSFSDRIMGNGLMENVDVTKRINSIYLLLFVLIPMSMIFIFKVLKKILDKTNIRILKFMELVSLLGIINTILGMANKIQYSNVLLTSIYALSAINIIVILTIGISRIRKKQYNFQNVKWAIISAIPIAFVSTLVLHKLDIIVMSVNTNWLISYVIGIALLLILMNTKFVNKEILKKAYIFFLVAPLLEMIYLELYNILNQYNIFLTHKIETIIIMYAICIASTIIYYVTNCNKKTIFRYTKVYYPILLVTFGAILASITMITRVDTDFFESANHGIGVYEFFRYGKIPLIETFDAHMLNNQLFGIIYGYLNNHDVLGAIFCLYNSYKEIIYYIVIYYFLKKIFSRDTAFLITMFFPIQLDWRN